MNLINDTLLLLLGVVIISSLFRGFSTFLLASHL